MKKVLGGVIFLLLLIPAGAFALTQNETQLVSTIKNVHWFLIIIGFLWCAIQFVIAGMKVRGGNDQSVGDMVKIGFIAIAILLSKPIFNIIIDQTTKAQVQNTDVQNVFK